MTVALYEATVRGDKVGPMSAHRTPAMLPPQRPKDRPAGMPAARARLLARRDAIEVEAPESGVHAIANTAGAHESGDMNSLIEQVTLIVYGWKNVEPGTLFWVFPSLAMALAAARTMTNAERWSIVAGRREAEVDVDRERSRGSILIEQPG